MCYYNLHYHTSNIKTGQRIYGFFESQFSRAVPAALSRCILSDPDKNTKIQKLHTTDVFPVFLRRRRADMGAGADILRSMGLCYRIIHHQSRKTMAEKSAPAPVPMRKSRTVIRL